MSLHPHLDSQLQAALRDPRVRSHRVLDAETGLVVIIKTARRYARGVRRDLAARLRELDLRATVVLACGDTEELDNLRWQSAIAGVHDGDRRHLQGAWYLPAGSPLRIVPIEQ